MLHDYFAEDINGNQIAREALDDETFRRHVSNLIVSGYRIKVRITGTAKWEWWS